jgi:hypothetical protein
MIDSLLGVLGMHRLFQNRVAAVATGAAVVVGLGATGAVAAGTIGSDDIRTGGVRTMDLRNGGVHKRDMHGSAVGSHEVLDESLGLQELRPSAVEELRSSVGERGPRGPRGPKGDDGRTIVADFAGDFSATNRSVLLTPDGVEFGPYIDGAAQGGAIRYDGLNGRTVASAVKSLVYYARYVSTGDTGGAGAPYLRIVTTDVDTDPDTDQQSWIFSPHTQAPDPDTDEGPFHEWVATSGSWRYNDDTGNGPDSEFFELRAVHGEEVISGISISTGFSAGNDLAALLRWLEVNGERYEFRGR